MKISIKKLLAIMLVLVTAISVLLFSQHFSSDKEQNDTAETASASTQASATALDTPAPSASIPAGMSYAEYIQPDNDTGFASSWKIKAEGKETSLQSDYRNETVTISKDTEQNDVNLFRNSFPFLKGNAYTISFNAYGTSNREIVLSVTDANTGNEITSQNYSISSSSHSFLLPVVPTADYYNGQLNFYVGGAAGSVVIADIRVINDNLDSAIKDIKVNQVAYSAEDMKRCTFSYPQGDLFDLVDQNTGETVYTGAVVNARGDKDTGETDVSYGDFSSFMKEGTYYIRSQTGCVSYPFQISLTPYVDLQKALVHMLSLQRCGMDLDSSWAGEFAHAFCHSQWPFIYKTGTSKPAGGGWHDAADYGRYVTTGAKAVSDLLISYLINPDAFSDDANGPDSGNWQADSLDEAYYELAWFGTMMTGDGSVYSKIVSSSVSGAADPSKDDQTLYLIDSDMQSTADFASVMEIASVVWKDADPNFSKTCSTLAAGAIQYLDAHPSGRTATNPPEINSGSYNDDYDADERFYAYAAAYYATGDASYLDKAKALFESDSERISGASWKDTGAFGKYLILKSNAETDNPDFYNAIKESLVQEADEILKQIDQSNYGVSLKQYTWGSNGFAIDNGEVLMMTYDIIKDQKYRQGAVQQVNYVLGQNSLNTCFVSTFGTLSPKHVHQYASNALGVVYPGALVGGPNADREETDKVASTMAADTPPAKMYSDSFESFSTNEVSVYWNSALIALTGMLS